MRTFSLLLLSGLVGLQLSAAPDCNWAGRWSNRPTDQADGVTTFKTNGATAVPGPSISNVSTGCTAWIMIVDVEGFSADSIVLQSAPNASPGAAGTFVTFAGSTTSGSNPTTTTTSSTYLATGYYPWFRANVTTVTGTPGSINVQIFGYRSQAYLTATGTYSADGTTICGTTTFSICTSALQLATVNVSSAQFLNLNSSPVQLIAAAGSGTCVLPTEIAVFYIYGGTAYVISTGNLRYAYGSAQSYTPVSASAANVTGAVANTLFTDINAFAVGTLTTSICINQALNWLSSVANPSTGNGTFVLLIKYFTMSGLS